MMKKEKFIFENEF